MHPEYPDLDRVRCRIAADDPLARAALVHALHGLVEVTEEAADVLILDLGLHPDDALERLREGPGSAEVVLALAPDAAAAEAALAAGVRGVVAREAGAARLRAAIEAVARGFAVLEPGWMRSRPAERELVEPLTPRERQVVGLLSEGLSNKEVAARLGVSEHTAKFHVNAAMGKLGAQSRTEAVVRAARLGLVFL